MRQIPDYPSILKARDALAFACIDGASDGNWCTGETFDSFQLNFHPGDSHMEYFMGSIVPVHRSWLEADEVVFPAPGEANTDYEARPSPDLLPGLCFLLENLHDEKRLRILRSLEFFRLACMNNTNLMVETRIVLMAAAFEALLGFTNRGEFRGSIGRLCSEVDEPTRQYNIEHHQPGSKAKVESLTDKQIWAEEFYKLRNAIVHTNDAAARRIFSTNVPHCRNATIFFRHCVRRELEQMEGLRYTSPTTIVQKEDFRFELDVDLLCDTNRQFEQ